ncbi:MAG TPA: type II toxin-antitoxin system death-on-curing family toxin [Polyangiales bacterium]|nr:type II toxin-antitoxin system death-on-curing family toxin [Polyangiales bacterium]
MALYLTLEEVLALHVALIARHGGAAGVRDTGLVESALARARSGYYDSLSEQASALLQSFAMNHAFIDGNKRVAWASSLVFLRMNGFRVRVSADEAERFLIDRVIVGRAELTAIAGWLEQYMLAVQA